MEMICKACKGEGVTKNNSICPVCKGEGFIEKISKMEEGNDSHHTNNNKLPNSFKNKK